MSPPLHPGAPSDPSWPATAAGPAVARRYTLMSGGRWQRSVIPDRRERGAAARCPRDWAAEGGDTDDGPLASEPIRASVAPVVVLTSTGSDDGRGPTEPFLGLHDR